MKALVTTLTEILWKEVRVFERLLETLAAEQEALVRQEVEAVETIVAEQKMLTETTGHLEKARIRVVARLAGAVGEDPAALTLKRLMERVAAPQAEQLAQVREALLEVQEKVRGTNRQNALLIKQSLKYVDKSLQILAGGEGPAGTYRPSGKIETRPSAQRTVMNQVV